MTYIALSSSRQSRRIRQGRDERSSAISSPLWGCRTHNRSCRVAISVFRSAAQPPARLEAWWKRLRPKHLDLQTDFFVRTNKDGRPSVAGNPFPDEARRNRWCSLVVCLKRPPTREAMAALQQAIVGREVVRAKGREAYIIYPDGVGQSRLTTTLMEKEEARHARYGAQLEYGGRTRSPRGRVVSAGGREERADYVEHSWDVQAALAVQMVNHVLKYPRDRVRRGC